MFTKLFRSVRRRSLCRQILTAHAELSHLTGDALIKQYVEERIRDYAVELARFKASIREPDSFGGQIQYPAPMDELLSRALLYVGQQPKAVYIRQTYLLSRETVELESQLEESRERNLAHLELEASALELATQFNEELLALERNQAVDSPTRFN